MVAFTDLLSIPKWDTVNSTRLQIPASKVNGKQRYGLWV